MIMNIAMIIGNLTKDPELRTTTQTGVSVCSFTVAVSRRASGDRKMTDFLPVVAWRSTAEACAKYLRKGSKVAVEGEIQTRSYEDNEGTKRYITEIVASEVQFLGARQDGQGGQQSQAPRAGTGPQDIPAGYGMEETDEDLPF